MGSCLSENIRVKKRWPNGIYATACPFCIYPILEDNQTSNPMQCGPCEKPDALGLMEDFQEKGTFEQDDWRKHIMKALTWHLYLFLFLISPKQCSLIIFLSFVLSFWEMFLCRREVTARKAEAIDQHSQLHNSHYYWEAQLSGVFKVHPQTCQISYGKRSLIFQITFT